MGGTRDRCADAIDVYAPERKRSEGRVVVWTRRGWWMLFAMEVVNEKVKVKVKMRVDTRRYGIRDPAGRRAPRNLLPRAPRLREFYFANGPNLRATGRCFDDISCPPGSSHDSKLRWTVSTNINTSCLNTSCLPSTR